MALPLITVVVAGVAGIGIVATTGWKLLFGICFGVGVLTASAGYWIWNTSAVLARRAAQQLPHHDVEADDERGD